MCHRQIPALYIICANSLKYVTLLRDIQNIFPELLTLKTLAVANLIY